MEKVTSGTAAAAEESAAASEELTAQAETSRGHLDELAAIVGAHARAGSAPTARRGEVRSFASPTRAPLKRVS